jgi:hypothetical protein
MKDNLNFCSQDTFYLHYQISHRWFKYPLLMPSYKKAYSLELSNIYAVTLKVLRIKSVKLTGKNSIRLQ